MGWESIQVFIRNLSAFLVVILLAFIVLRYGLGYFSKKLNRGIIKIVERVVLDPRRGNVLYLVEVGDLCYLLGISQGSVSLIKELPAETVEKFKEERLKEENPMEGLSFREVLGFIKKEKD